VLTCFAMIWNYDKFSRWNTNPSKICAFWKNLIPPNLIVKTKWHLGAIMKKMYKKFQKSSLENSSWGKHVFWGKKPQKRQ
jgi:hypothetical protein